MVTIRLKDRGGAAGTGICDPRFHPMDRTHEKVLQLRTLAARLRGHAAETALEIFQDKFRASAAELEEAALSAENEARFPSPTLGTQNGPEYRH
jgi:hypothetical protein